MIITVYEKRLDVHNHPVVSRYIGVQNLKVIDGELHFAIFRTWKSDFRDKVITDYFYYLVENDPESPNDVDVYTT